MSTIQKAAARLVKKPSGSGKKDNKTDNTAEVDSTHALREFNTSETEPNQTSAFPGVSRPAHQYRDELQDQQTDQTSVDEGIYTNSCELDFPWLEENGFLVPNHNNHKQSQEFRRIKRPLLANLRRQDKEYKNPTNVIYVTSALPQEGKTFVSLNLALSLAGELDRSVLLVDGDAAKGDLSRWMGIYDEHGLVDMLSSGKDNVEASTIETNVDRLSVMPCGKRTENLDELYASDVMKSLVAQLANSVEDRIVVIDGPPLIATTEAAVLATLMGQTIVVVEAGKTPQAAVEQAVGQLEECQLVSMLLNKVSSSSQDAYGYGYGYGAEPKQTAQASN
ncbi:MAG: protein-tyrosine kinase [Candidatus Azotimanducaceae bacterium]|jgi:protein-tyrosine kinase